MKQSDYQACLEAICDRVTVILEETGPAFPFVRTGERWETTADGNWCPGHWIGLLSLAAKHEAEGSDSTGSTARLREAAASCTERMIENEALLESHFAGMNYEYAGFRAADLGRDRRGYGIGLMGADAMAALFHDRGRQIRVGDFPTKGPTEEKLGDTAAERPDPPLAAVDVIYTAVPILWRAFRETSDERFRDVALSHADRHLDWFLGADGSTHQLTAFEDDTGRHREDADLLAHSTETCWARGLGWHVAGLARAYRETGADRYLAAIERSIGYYREHAPDDRVPYWDFEVTPRAGEPRDTSTAALVAYGLLELPAGDTAVQAAIPDTHRERCQDLRQFGEAVLESILAEYVVWDGAHRGAVTETCYSKPEDYATNCEAIWTNYYVAMACRSVVES